MPISSKSTQQKKAGNLTLLAIFNQVINNITNITNVTVLRY